MGMPVLLYRWYFGAYGLRGFERSMLSFAGIKPIRESLYGLSFANESRRRRWIEEMRSHGARGDNGAANASSFPIPLDTCGRRD